MLPLSLYDTPPDPHNYKPTTTYAHLAFQADPIMRIIKCQIVAPQPPPPTRPNGRKNGLRGGMCKALKICGAKASPPRISVDGWTTGTDPLHCCVVWCVFVPDDRGAMWTAGVVADETIS